MIKKFTKDLIKETTKVQDILCPKKVQPKISYLRKKPKVPDVCVIEIISDSSIEVVKEKKSTIAWRWVKKLNLEKAIAESLKKETPSKELYKK